MNLKEVYEMLYKEIIGSEELSDDGFCLQLKLYGNFDKLRYKKIVKMINDASEEISSKELVSSEECLEIVGLANTFYSEIFHYLFLAETNKEIVDTYYEVREDFDCSFVYSKKDANYNI